MEEDEQANEPARHAKREDELDVLRKLILSHDGDDDDGGDDENGEDDDGDGWW